MTETKNTKWLYTIKHPDKIQLTFTTNPDEAYKAKLKGCTIYCKGVMVNDTKFFKHTKNTNNGG